MREENQMPQEYDGVVSEAKQQIEMSSYAEYFGTQEQRIPPETSPNPSPPKPKSKPRNRLSALFLAALTAITFSSGAMQEGLLQASPPQVELSALSSDGKNLYYEVQVANGEGLSAVLENEVVAFRESLDVGENDGSFAGLAAGMSYTFSVVEEGLLGDRMLFSRSVVIPDPVEVAQVQLTSYQTEPSRITVNLAVQCAITLQASLTCAEESDTYPLQNGEQSLVFENLKRGVPYTLTVTGQGLWEEEVLLTQQITIPPQPTVTIAFDPATDGNMLFLRGNVQSEVPLSITLGGYSSFDTRPLQNGEVELVFEALIEGAEYWLQVVWETETHRESFYQKSIQIPHPLHYAYVELLELGQAETGVSYAFIIDAAVPLEIVLFNQNNPAEQYRKEVIIGGDHVGVFENLTVGQTYVIAVVGQGLYGEVEIFRESITILDPTVL